MQAVGPMVSIVPRELVIAIAREKEPIMMDPSVIKAAMEVLLATT